MNYTRKRALLACDFCRYRKRRCDGQTPCSTCRDAKADCVYKELPADRVEDASPLAVVDRLARIEALLERQGQQLQQHLFSHPSPTFSSAYDSENISPPAASQTPRYHEALMQADGGTQEGPQFLVPSGHTAVTSTLLALPGVRDRVGHYPRDYFYAIEEALPLPRGLNSISGNRTNWPVLDEKASDALITSYFRRVHPHRPLFSEQQLRSWQHKLSTPGSAGDIEVALSLCVYALGSIAVQTPDGRADDRDGALASSLFEPALRIALSNYTWSFTPSLAVSQALLLCSSYFGYLGRPLHCWRLACFASQGLLQILDARNSSYADCSDEELRVFWLSFLVDCKSSAELDVARSGVEPLGDRMPLPSSLGPDDGDETMGFVAEIALQRLLNRIHSSLYSPEATEQPPSLDDPRGLTRVRQGLGMPGLLALSGELNRQLEEWYFSMPESLRPLVGIGPVASNRGRALRIRYYEARHLIHRPFVMHTVQCGPPPAAVEEPAVAPDPVVLNRCQVCVESCVAYIYNAAEMLDRRSGDLWSIAHGCMACLIVLRTAGSHPALCHLVPPLRPLHHLVVTQLQRWATPGSSFEAEVVILETLWHDGSATR